MSTIASVKQLVPDLKISIILLLLTNIFMLANPVLSYNSAVSTRSEDLPNSAKLLGGTVQENHSLELDNNTKTILQKELELARLNTSFRMETTLVRQWRQRRVFLYGEASASTALAASCIAMPILYKTSNPKTHLSRAQFLQNRTELVAATRTSLVGQSIGAGGDVVELALNFCNYLSLRRRGFVPKIYRNRVHALRQELDGLIAQRQALLISNSTLTSAEIIAADAESKLLNDIRDLSLLEFSRFHSATRRFWTLQNTAFLVDFAKNMTGASASIIGLSANHLERPGMIGGAGVLSIISGAIVLATPVVGRVTGNLSGLAAARTASKELTNMQAENSRNYTAHKHQLFAVLDTSNESTPYLNSARARMSMYAQGQKSSLSMREFLLNQRKRGKGTLTENIIFASIVGPPRVYGGVANVLSSWKYYDNKITTSRLTAAAATGNCVGAGFGVFEIARVEVSSELYNHRIAKTNLLPVQQFKQRLQSLDAMEQEIKN